MSQAHGTSYMAHRHSRKVVHCSTQRARFSRVNRDDWFLTHVATSSTHVPEGRWALREARLWAAVAPHGTRKGDNDIAGTTKEAGARFAGIGVSLPN